MKKHVEVSGGFEVGEIPGFKEWEEDEVHKEEEKKINEEEVKVSEEEEKKKDEGVEDKLKKYLVNRKRK